MPPIVSEAASESAPSLSSLHQVREDLMALAGRNATRSAQTEGEKNAAEYIRDRLRQSQAPAVLEEFVAPEGHYLTFAIYYGEFFVVALIAYWLPLIALLYGSAMFVAYLAEFMGYSLVSRVLPGYESQNVVGRHGAPGAEQPVVVVTAYYDSGNASPYSAPAFVPWMRWFYVGVLAAMAAVLASCAFDTLEVFTDMAVPYVALIRWGGLVPLFAAAAFMFFAHSQSEDVRGANNNASGVAGMLRLAQHLGERPLQHLEVWYVAAGSHESWMAGLRAFLAAHDLPPRSTYVINLEAIGSGTVQYITREGVLHAMPASPALVRAAEHVAGRFGIAPAAMRAIPSAAHVPLAKGYPSLSVMALGARGLPEAWCTTEDLVGAVDEITVTRAADFAEALLRDFDRDVAPQTS